jgi:hypothetical protein
MEDTKELLWIVGRLHSGDEGSWEVLGIYSSREKAIARCRTAFDFIATVVLDSDAPEERVAFPHYEFPIVDPRT